MSYAPYIKEFAYKIDPECWISYSGAPIWRKRAMDVRRFASLEKAKGYFAEVERHRAWIANAVGRCVAETTAFGPQAGDALFRKFIREIEEGKHLMKSHITRDQLRDAIREILRDHGVNAARAIVREHGAGATSVSRIPDHLVAAVFKACRKKQFLASRNQKADPMPPLKIKMMLHFASVVGPFAPETTRTSEAYTTFVKELLRDGMIERPTNYQRAQYPGWAYKATSRGQCYVQALTEVPLPIRTNPEWAMPSRG